ncbi:hypothetical protein JCM11641_005642, partial [Rhodosporidiobolus odoratus]
MDMSGMDMGGTGMDGMDMGSGGSDAACKATGCSHTLAAVRMLWNWYTIDACFLSERWHVRSVGDYVGTILGVFFIVVALEGVRRLSREYDRSIRRAYYVREDRALSALAKNSDALAVGKAAPFRPSFTEHLVRSVFYGVQFGTAYILMLLAMYFNGGIILAIVVGGFVGYGLFA